jgi:hypothetical protein
MLIVGKSFLFYAHPHVASNIDIVALLFRGIEKFEWREAFALWIEEEKLLIRIANKAWDLGFGDRQHEWEYNHNSAAQTYKADPGGSAVLGIEMSSKNPTDTGEEELEP